MIKLIDSGVLLGERPVDDKGPPSSDSEMSPEEEAELKKRLGLS